MDQTGENGYMMVRCLPIDVTSAQPLQEFCLSLLQTWKRSHTLIHKCSRKDSVGHLYEENFVRADDFF